MSFEVAFYLVCVVLIGIPASFRFAGGFGLRNASALGMVAMYFTGFAIYLATGEGMPIRAMILQDMVVIACIYAKKDWRDCSPYRTFAEQLKAAWCERSPWDRGILALFVPAWAFYTGFADPQTTYWTLYGIGLAQLLLAGWEALDPWLRTNGQSSRADAPGPPGSLFAPARGEAYG